MNDIENDLFVKEMRIFWQNIGNGERNEFGYLIINYFGEERAKPILNKLRWVEE